MEIDTYNDSSFNSNNSDNREPEYEQSDEETILLLGNKLHDADRRNSALVERLKKCASIVDMKITHNNLSDSEWRELKELLKPYSA